MAQSDFGTINPTTTSGTALASILGNWRDAVHSSHKGDSPPSYAVAGMIWCDDTATPWALKVYDGTDWIVIGYVDTSANVYLISDEAVFADPADLTKRLRMNTENIGPGNTRVVTWPNQNVTITSTAAGLLDDTSAGAMRTTLGATSVGGDLFTAVSASAARGTLGGSAVGQAIFTAANVAAAQSASGLVTRVKTSNQTSVTSAWADVTDLSFPVESGETWTFELDAVVSMSDHAANTQVGFNGPAFGTLNFSRIRLGNGANPGISPGFINQTNYDEGEGAALQNQYSLALHRGFVTFSASGTFTVRLRRSTSIGTATIYASSILRATRIS